MPDQRQIFFEAAAFFIAVVERIRDDQWNGHGLGVWSVRELVAHTALAFTNLEREVTTLAQPSVPNGGALSTAVDFYQRGMAMPGVNERVAQRGREAVESLGDDPSASIRALEAGVRDLLGRTPDTVVIAPPIAALPLSEYLLTKTFELTVHTLDIAAALDLDVEPPAAPLAACLGMVLSLAARRDTSESVSLLRALTGRAPLPASFTVL